MSFISEKYQGIPTGFRKILHFHWPIALLLTSVSFIGFLMLFSVSGGNFNKWAEPQIIRFCIGFIAMIVISFTPISIWRSMSIPTYLISLILLFYVEYFGITGKGAQRWIDLGFIRLQPSEFMKIALVMVIALYYDWLGEDKVSKLRWLLPPILLTALPMILVLRFFLMYKPACPTISRAAAMMLPKSPGQLCAVFMYAGNVSLAASHTAS